ncbi:MAG: hypothetical protein AAF391_08060 [Bacteroidota bacterium]
MSYKLTSHNGKEFLQAFISVFNKHTRSLPTDQEAGIFWVDTQHPCAAPLITTLSALGDSIDLRTASLAIASCLADAKTQKEYHAIAIRLLFPEAVFDIAQARVEVFWEKDEEDSDHTTVQKGGQA